MKVVLIESYVGGEPEPIELKSVKILLNDDCEIEISQNKFGELVINKHHYTESSTINIQPNVSNEINIA